MWHYSVRAALKYLPLEKNDRASTSELCIFCGALQGQVYSYESIFGSLNLSFYVVNTTFKIYINILTKSDFCKHSKCI